MSRKLGDQGKKVSAGSMSVCQKRQHNNGARRTEQEKIRTEEVIPKTCRPALRSGNKNDGGWWGRKMRHARSKRDKGRVAFHSHFSVSSLLTPATLLFTSEGNVGKATTVAVLGGERQRCAFVWFPRQPSKCFDNNSKKAKSGLRMTLTTHRSGRLGVRGDGLGVAGRLLVVVGVLALPLLP